MSYQRLGNTRFPQSTPALPGATCCSAQKSTLEASASWPFIDSPFFTPLILKRFSTCSGSTLVSRVFLNPAIYFDSFFGLSNLNCIFFPTGYMSSFLVFTVLLNKFKFWNSSWYNEWLYRNPGIFLNTFLISLLEPSLFLFL
jgi:hypothetical protein